MACAGSSSSPILSQESLSSASACTAGLADFLSSEPALVGRRRGFAIGVLSMTGRGCEITHDNNCHRSDRVSSGRDHYRPTNWIGVSQVSGGISMF